MTLVLVVCGQSPPSRQATWAVVPANQSSALPPEVMLVLLPEIMLTSMACVATESQDGV